MKSHSIFENFEISTLEENTQRCIYDMSNSFTTPCIKPLPEGSTWAKTQKENRTVAELSEIHVSDESDFSTAFENHGPKVFCVMLILFSKFTKNLPWHCWVKRLNNTEIHRNISTPHCTDAVIHTLRASVKDWVNILYRTRKKNNLPWAACYILIFWEKWIQVFIICIQ